MTNILNINEITWIIEREQKVSISNQALSEAWLQATQLFSIFIQLQRKTVEAVLSGSMAD